MLTRSTKRSTGLVTRLRPLLGSATAAVLLIFLAAAGPASATTVVVALWHLDEAPGSPSMADSSGYGHDGTISSDVVLGISGALPETVTGYQFTGSAPIVRVPNAVDLNPKTAPLTISAHLKLPADLPVGDYNVLQKGTATATGGAYKLEISGRKGAKFGFPDCAFNSPGVKERVYGPTAINDGTWHLVQCHLTATQVYVTVDGASGPALNRTVGNIANNIDVTLGGKPNNTHYFEGLADEVSISIG